MYRLPDEETPPSWNPACRPPSEVCPRRFCFNFIPGGSQFAPGLHASPEEAMHAAVRVGGDQCSGSFGRCARGGLGGVRDLYEPNEPELERAGLPWFYFIASASQLVEELRDQYLAEAAALWGPE